MYSGGANSVERGHQVMANDGSQQRKPDFRTALEDVKALATVLVMQLESVLGRRLTLRSLAVLAATGVVATLVLALVLGSPIGILELSVSFAFALALIWIKERVVAKLERDQKQDTLYTILTHDLQDIKETDKGLEELIRSYSGQDEISPRMFLTNLTPVEYARRLAELDRQHAYVYSAYQIEAEGARKRDETLDKLREQFFQEDDKDNRRKLGQAIQKQAELARKDNITLLEKELAVVKRIQEARDKDKKTVTQFETIIEDLKKETP
jgi:hypothetical protein